jgi:hypothetical protein
MAMYVEQIVAEGGGSGAGCAALRSFERSMLDRALSIDWGAWETPSP